MAPKLLDSQTLFEGKLLRIRVDRLEHPGGHIQPLELVEHPGAIALVPIDADGAVWLVRQYRHPAREYLLEIPAGTLDPDEEPAACARRECQEEIGMAPGELVHLATGFMAPGYSTEQLHFFLARSLVPSALAPDEDEQLEIHTLPLAESWQAVADGRICDVKTIAGLALANEYLKQETGASEKK
jgi:ADP-ribose pyrophosphatase